VPGSLIERFACEAGDQASLGVREGSPSHHVKMKTVARMSTSHDAHDVQLADAVLQYSPLLSSSGKNCREPALYQSVAFTTSTIAGTSCSLVYSSVIGDGIRILHSTVGRAETPRRVHASWNYAAQATCLIQANGCHGYFLRCCESVCMTWQWHQYFGDVPCVRLVLSKLRKTQPWQKHPNAAETFQLFLPLQGADLRNMMLREILQESWCPPGSEEQQPINGIWLCLDESKSCVATFDSRQSWASHRRVSTL
jgi:hypothetical protein